METIDNMQEQVGNLSRKMEIRSKNQTNTWYQKHYTRNEECFRGQVSGVDMAE